MLGWILSGFINQLEKAVTSVSGNFIQSTGQEIDRLFDEKLSPLAEQLDYIAQKRIQESREQMEELETKTQGDIAELLNNADEALRENLLVLDLVRENAILDLRETLGVANFMLENQINRISLITMEALQFTQDGLENSLRELHNLEDKLFLDATSLIDKLIQEFDEVLEGKMEKFSLELKKYLAHALPGPFDRCKRHLKLHWKFGHQLSDIELYRLAECYELCKIHGHTPIDEVLEIYGQLQLNAARMAALVRNAPELKRRAVEDWLKYGVLCEFWRDTIKLYETPTFLLEAERSQNLLSAQED